MTTNPDMYERHRQAVETWREACQNIEFAEKQRDEARQVLDNATDAIAASCAQSSGKAEKKTRRRRVKVTGAVVEQNAQRWDSQHLKASQ